MAPASEPLAGRIVGGRYRIEALLGSGGMGVLYSAEHVLTQRKVALKLLHPSSDDELVQLRARFLSEARTAAAVRHPHVVDVLDMGTDERGLPFLVMELLQGQSLDRAILAEGRLSPEQTLAYLLPIAGALAVLHDAGIVHRDVKPSNIFLCRTATGKREPKLLDFGLARMVSDLRLTRSGVVIGTPLYMSPEHAAGAQVGPAADVWSLGVVLYECLSGTSPYNSTDSAVIATQIMAGRIRPLHEICKDLPPPFAHAVERALRRDLEHRYRDMRDLARGLLAGAKAANLRVPEDPDPIGLAGFRSWNNLGESVDTAAGRETPSSPQVPLPAHLPPSPGLADHDSQLMTGSSSRLLALGLAVIVTLSIALVVWLFAQPAPTEQEATTPGDSGDGRVLDVRAPEVRPTPSSPPPTPTVEPLQAIPEATSPPPANTPTTLAPASVRENSPAPARPRRARQPEPTPQSPAAERVSDGPRTIDVTNEWK